MQFVDANMFLRLLTGTPPDQAKRAYGYFKQLEAGGPRAITSESVVAEIVRVLLSSRNYGLPRPEVARRIRTLLHISGLTVPHAGAIWEASECLEESRLDFVDCLNVAHMNRLGINEIVSFDRDFDRFPEITRVEP